MATLAQIRERTAKRLGRYSEGMTLSASVTDHLTNTYNALWAEWAELGVAVWASAVDVPEKFEEAVIRAMAFRCKDDFGISNDRYKRIVADAGINGEKAEALARRMAAGEYQPDVTSFKDF